MEEQQYLDILKQLIDYGDERQTRNSITKTLFSTDVSFDLKKGFPLLTTKKMFIRGIFEELMFFIRGETNTKLLEDKNVNIWKGNTSREFLDSVGLSHYKEGDMGPMYGYIFRHHSKPYNGTDGNQGIDQLQYVLNTLINDPYSRRIIMTSFNPAQVNEGCLYPCHSIVVQFFVRKHEGKYYVSQKMYQRSVDTVCGFPFNIASSALFSHIICSTLNSITDSEQYIPDMLHITLGDYHIYKDHYDVAMEQIKRTPFPFPTLNIKTKYKNIEDYSFEDIELVNYQCHPHLKAQMVS
jgi:thymidylate synthase